jgi:hypothetical protein
MRKSHVILVMLSTLLAACVASPNPSSPRIARLPAGELARLSAEQSAPTLDELLSMAHSGASAEAIIARFRQSNARLDLTPAQVLDLHARGLPLPVLQAIDADRESALRNERAQQLIQRDQQCALAVEHERQRWLRSAAPYGAAYPGAWGYPYGPGGMRSGMHSGLMWGW